ncbi:MAG: HAMP domain-containing histidine kinase [Gemmatimonadetes bacterium]|nr:HAMP domain-containing histidine kinase [Gemmatimonadota bacterium]
MFSSWGRRGRDSSKSDVPEPAAERAADSAEPASPPTMDPSAQRQMGLLSLLELSNELNVRSSVFELADVALFNLLGHFGCARGAVWLLPERKTDDAVLVRSQGVPDTVARGLGTLWTPWFQRRGVLQDSVHVATLTDDDPPAGKSLAEQGEIALLAPLSARRKLVGLVALGKRVGGGDFDLIDREILQAALNLLAVALQSTSIYGRAMENNRQLRVANEQLQDANRLKSEFLQNMNHEFRTPITILTAYVEMMQKMEADGAPLGEHLKVVAEQTGSLHAMLVNLLDFSMLEQDSLEIRPERSDVREVIARYYRDRQPGASAELRELLYSAASDVPPAIHDRERTVQIVETLVSNAIKFTPPGARIHLRVEPENLNGRDFVRIDVEDNGPGIPEERQESMFESFRQGDGSTTREHGGLGLGLALARRLAVEMNGDLSLHSEVGEGATFTLRLPAA